MRECLGKFLQSYQQNNTDSHGSASNLLTPLNVEIGEYVVFVNAVRVMEDDYPLCSSTTGKVLSTRERKRGISCSGVDISKLCE